LNSFFQRNVFRRRDDQVKVVRHNHELMEEKAAFLAIVLQDVEEQESHFRFLEEGITPVRDGRYEKRSDFLRSIFHSHQR